MKKTLIAVAAAAALTTSAFAEITFGAWGRTILVPIASNGDKTVAGQNQSWGGYGRAIGMDINGSDAEGKAGFSMSYRNTTEDPSWDNPYSAKNLLGENAHFWIKPVDQVKIYAGKVEWNALRGNACLPAWDWIRPSFEVGEDHIFKNYAGTGLLADIRPMDNLIVYVGVPLTNAFSSTKDDKSNDEAANVYKRTQAGFGYTIDGIGTIKAQFRGVNTEKEIAGKKYNYTGNVGASFDLTAVENLWVAVGVDYALEDKEMATEENNVDMKIALGASYKISDEFSVMANGKVLLPVNYEKPEGGKDIDTGYQFAVGASYKIQDGLTAVAEVGYLGERKCGEVTLNESAVSALAGVNCACGAANVGIGFQMITNVTGQATGLAGIKNPKPDTTKKSTQWAVPVVITLGL